MSSNIKRYYNDLTFSAKRQKYTCKANCNHINSLKQITFPNNNFWK